MIDALVARALQLRYEEDERWEPIHELHGHGDPVAVQAVVRPMLVADDPFERALAADVLGRVGGPDAPDRAERATLLIERLAVEDDPLALSADPVAETRDWATWSLGNIGHHTGPRVVAALLARLGDEDDDTRAEALHGLALRADPRVIEPLLTEMEDYEGRLVDHALTALALRFPDDARLTAAVAERWPEGVPDDVREVVEDDLETLAEWGRP